jgi:hypothetical protein
MELFVADEIVDVAPDGEGHGVGDTNDVTNVGGEILVQPLDDALVHRRPLFVLSLGCGRGGGDVTAHVAGVVDNAIHVTAPL